MSHGARCPRRLNGLAPGRRGDITESNDYDGAGHRSSLWYGPWFFGSYRVVHRQVRQHLSEAHVRSALEPRLLPLNRLALSGPADSPITALATKARARAARRR